MNCRVLICLGLFVLFSWSCSLQNKESEVEESEEVKVALSTLEKDIPVLEKSILPLESVPVEEDIIINVLYPEYFEDVFDSEMSVLVGVDYLQEDFSFGDKHTIEEVTAYKLDSKQRLVQLHWSPVNGPGSSVSEFFVVKQNGKSVKVLARTTENSRFEFGGGTLAENHPEATDLYPLMDGHLFFSISHVTRHAPSDSFNEEVLIFEVIGEEIAQVLEFTSFSGHSSFRLREVLASKNEDLVEIGMMIPNHVYRHDIEQIETNLLILPNVTNGHNDILLKEELFHLTDDLKEIIYKASETLYQFDGESYVEDGKVSS
ncbi:MAG: hypothetical protein AAF502_01470 [Bacteroidota bacterium]